MKIARYQPQLVNPVERSPSTVGFEQEAQVGSAMTDLGKGISQAGGVVNEFATRMIAQRNSTEFANARAEYQRFLTDTQQKYRETAYNARRDGSVNYESFPTQFENEAKNFAEKHINSMSYRGGRQAFKNWMAEQEASGRDSMTKLSWEMQIALGVESFNNNITEAVDRGDADEVRRLIQENVVAGVVSDANAMKISEQISRDMQTRGIVLDSYNIAAETGSQRQGYEALNERMNESYTDILTGEERTLSLGDREKIVSDYNQKWNQETKMRKEERDAEFFPLFDQLHTHWVNGDLTVEMVMNNPATAFTEHDRFNMRDYFIGKLRGDVDTEGKGKISYDEWNTIVRDLYTDPNIDDQTFRSTMMGFRGDGLPDQIFDKFFGKRRFPGIEVATAFRSVQDVGDQLMAVAKTSGDGEAIFEAVRQVAWAGKHMEEQMAILHDSQLSPEKLQERIAQLGANTAAAMVDRKNIDKMRELIIGEDFTPGPAFHSFLGWNIGSGTHIYQFQEFLETKGAVGFVNNELRDQINRLGHVYAMAVRRDIGDGFVWERTESGQPFGMITLPEDSQGISADGFPVRGDRVRSDLGTQYVSPDGVMSITYTTNSTLGGMELKIWSHATETWHNLDERMRGVLYEGGVWTRDYREDPANRGSGAVQTPIPRGRGLESPAVPPQGRPY